MRISEDAVGTVARFAYMVITPFALSAILFLGGEIYARRDAGATAR